MAEVYNSNSNLKAAGVQVDFTPDDIKEYIKCLMGKPYNLRIQDVNNFSTEDANKSYLMITKMFQNHISKICQNGTEKPIDI